MAEIQILDKHTINQIAAGEVVESPKSVVKELAENAMDAGATTITVEIREGGISYIRITDNGCGIPKEEVKNAFLRHATSKLTQIEDLEHIYTMGFRGEALASIAAVAQVEMLTKTKEEPIGTRLEIEGGEIKSIQDAVCAEGTTVIVKNLFYNVPARRKFLKKPAKESGYVSELMNQLALGHPEISFCYLNNDTTVLHTTGNGDGKAAAFYVYGKVAAQSMLELSFERGPYRLHGLIGKPELSRGNRGYENLFINGRYIKNRIVSSAVEEAYRTRTMIGKFPVYILHLEIDPAQVDVNVHPAKLEVRFQNDDEVYDFFYDAIFATFEGKVLIPRVGWDKAPVEENIQQDTEQNLPKMPQKQSFEQYEAQDLQQYEEKEAHALQEKTIQSTQKEAPMQGAVKSVDELLHHQTQKPLKVQQATVAYDTALSDFAIEEPVQTMQHPPKEIMLEEMDNTKDNTQAKPFFHNYRIVGQLFATYWMVEQGESVYLIDQHAAHERILYERLMHQFREETVLSQRLVVPVMLHLTPMEIQILQDNMVLLEQFGFGLERFGADRYGLTAVPVLLREPSSTAFFTEILDMLADGTVSNIYDTKILAVATMACKAAVKGHDKLSIQEAEALIVQLLKLENPFTCPHGRPTIIEMTKYELEKKFKRIQD